MRSFEDGTKVALKIMLPSWVLFLPTFGRRSRRPFFVVGTFAAGVFACLDIAQPAQKGASK
jgi:hypothetical protein